MERYATAPMTQTYILQGYGAIQDDWVRSCLHLFKSQQINLRKVVLMRNGSPDCFSMVEFHFILPRHEGDNPATTANTEGLPQSQQEQPFLEQLQESLARQNWIKQSLQPGVR